MSKDEVYLNRDISGDVRLNVVFVEKGTASGHSVCMSNVGVKRIYIHRN